VTSIRVLHSADLSQADLDSMRRLFDEAWHDEGFTDEDWEHAFPGMHYIVGDEGDVRSHVAVVERELHIAGRPLRTGYVENVATRAAERRRGLGTAVMTLAGERIRASFELGALGTGEFGFYERLRWERWRGPTSVRAPSGERRTPDEDGDVMILRTASTPADLDLEAPISCDWRPGDVW
jgi:aminoglycoside 2'-N-acetyltransferase I